MDSKKLVERAYSTAPTKILEDMATQSFVYGVRDDPLRHAMLLMKFTSTKEAIGKAIETAFKTSTIKGLQVTNSTSGQAKRTQENCG